MAHLSLPLNAEFVLLIHSFFSFGNSLVLDILPLMRINRLERSLQNLSCSFGNDPRGVRYFLNFAKDVVLLEIRDCERTCHWLGVQHLVNKF